MAGADSKQGRRLACCPRCDQPVRVLGRRLAAHGRDGQRCDGSETRVGDAIAERADGEQVRRG